jgi:flagellar hook-basal body complex protein FliE
MAAPIGAGSAAAAAYRAVQGLGAEAPAVAGWADAGGGFGAVLAQVAQGALEAGHAADAASAGALSGQGGVTEVVMAVSKAELALQTAVAVRDRVVAAYQDIMRMPI